MTCLFKYSYKLVLSSVLARNVTMKEYERVARSLCRILKPRVYCGLSHRSFSATSARLASVHQQQHHLSVCHSGTNIYNSGMLVRYYSDSHNVINDSETLSGQDEVDWDCGSQKSLEAFSIDTVAALLRQENAKDICVIKVPEDIKYTKYFIVASGISTRHLRAMALYAVKVYKFMKKENDPNVKIEGQDTEDWMCIDFGSMVLHLMMPETREVYELEKLWTLRSYDEQLKRIPQETLPEDFMYGLEDIK